MATPERGDESQDIARDARAGPSAVGSAVWSLFTEVGQPWYWILTAVVILSTIFVLWFIDPSWLTDRSRRPALLTYSGGFGISLPLYVAMIRAVWLRTAARQAAKQKSIDSSVKALSDKGQREPAWDLARDTLEQYWDRNASQNFRIFLLSVTAIGLGFIVMFVGAVSALSGKSSVKAAAVATIAGVLTQFIAATFLFVYRSTMEQMTTFNATLERINSVGMALTIVNSMSDATPSDRGLRNRLKGHVALQIVNATSSAVTTRIEVAPETDRDKEEPAKPESDHAVEEKKKGDSSGPTSKATIPPPELDESVERESGGLKAGDRTDGPPSGETVLAILALALITMVDEFCHFGVRRRIADH
jgi:hypothetical protein